MTPDDFPAGRCDGVVLHWSAGKYLTWFGDYHLCILGPPRDGEVIRSHPFLHNLRDIAPGMEYAAHTWRRNSWRLGIAVMAMYGATSGNYGAFPPTPKQIEVMCALAALAVVRYAPPMLDAFVRTHCEWARTDGYFPNRWDWMREAPMLKGKVRYYVNVYRTNPKS